MVPSGIAADCGAMAIETKTTELTFKLAEPEMLPLTTVITVLPALTAVASP
jgi:hypothetical protein